jgi:hypothetical protein
MLRTLLVTAGIGAAALLCAGNDSYAAKEGQKCGTTAGIQCDAGLWCDLRGKCGTTDLPGKCVKIRDTCEKNIKEVCGCDKQTYANDCRRIQQKVQKDHNGKCR